MSVVLNLSRCCTAFALAFLLLVPLFASADRDQTTTVTASVIGHVLDLSTAEAIALANDQSIVSLELQAKSLDELAISAHQRPDLKLKFGTLALPIDTFDLDQEPMTQLQFGFQQHFPPRQQLAAKSRRFDAGRDALLAEANDSHRMLQRELRLAFVEAVYQQHAGSILSDSRQRVLDLAELSEDYYAAGHTSQQDVYRARLELSRLDEQLAATEQSEQETRAALMRWLDQDAYRPLPYDWPTIAAPPAATALMAGLPTHPKLAAMSARSAAAQATIDLARSERRPGWTLDMNYGDRSGRNVDGSRRADFVSAMVSVDLPLFTANRQDRQIAAGLRQAEAVAAMQADLERQLRSEISANANRHDHLQRRLRLYQERLIPEAAAHREASMLAYQSGAGDMTGLMRAQITEYELLLDLARLRAEQLQTRARLWYFHGGDL